MSSINVGAKIVTDGLILYLDAANPLSYPGIGANWNDISQYKNNSTLVNGPTFNTDYCGGFSFDGIDDYATTSQPSNLTPSPLTLSVWITIDPGNNIAGLISAFHYPSSPLSGVVMDIDVPGDLFEFYIYENNFTYIYTITTLTSYLTPVVNLTVTYDGSNANGVKMYINGNDLPTTIVKNDPVTSFSYNMPWVIGGVFNTVSSINDFPFLGNIYIAQAYNRALSLEEVLQNYNALKSRFGFNIY